MGPFADLDPISRKKGKRRRSIEQKGKKKAVPSQSDQKDQTHFYKIP